MADSKSKFRCIILSPKNLIYENEVASIFVQGDRGEFELLAYHYPLVGVVITGDIVIDEAMHIPIKSGIVRFYANECTILVEETPETVMIAKQLREEAKAKI